MKKLLKLSILGLVALGITAPLQGVKVQVTGFSQGEYHTLELEAQPSETIESIKQRAATDIKLPLRKDYKLRGSLDLADQKTIGYYDLDKLTNNEPHTLNFVLPETLARVQEAQDSLKKLKNPPAIEYETPPTAAEKFMDNEFRPAYRLAKDLEDLEILARNNDLPSEDLSVYSQIKQEAKTLFASLKEKLQSRPDIGAIKEGVLKIFEEGAATSMTVEDLKDCSQITIVRALIEYKVLFSVFPGIKLGQNAQKEYDAYVKALADKGAKADSIVLLFDAPASTQQTATQPVPAVATGTTTPKPPLLGANPVSRPPQIK